MTMQLLAPLEFAIGGVLSKSRGQAAYSALSQWRRCALMLNSLSSLTRSGGNFETTMVKLDETRHISEVTLAPVALRIFESERAKRLVKVAEMVSKRTKLIDLLRRKLGRDRRLSFHVL